MKITESTHLVRFQDCDPFNHLNNSKYIDYFICAREDHLKDYYQFNIFEHAKNTGKSWVVGQNQIAYLSPALLMEKVIIQSSILEWNKYDILVEMQMWDEQRKKLKSLLWIRFVHYDLRTSKKIEHDDKLTAQFLPFVDEGHKKKFFEERLMEIRN